MQLGGGGATADDVFRDFKGRRAGMIRAPQYGFRFFPSKLKIEIESKLVQGKIKAHTIGSGRDAHRFEFMGLLNKNTRNRKMGFRPET